jgi:DegV family protein with EDD domain
MSYQIITDATADMDWNLWDVCVIPMEVRLNQLAYSYGPDGAMVSIHDFYKEQQAGAETSTSQISPFEFNRVFERYLSQGEDILYLGFSSGMSGTFQNACLTADELMEQYPKRRIVCVDTLAASVMEGYLVYEAARKKGRGSFVRRPCGLGKGTAKANLLPVCGKRFKHVETRGTYLIGYCFGGCGSSDQTNFRNK